jgi:hypothetical protein
LDQFPQIFQFFFENLGNFPIIFENLGNFPKCGANFPNFQKKSASSQEKGNGGEGHDVLPP